MGLKSKVEKWRKYSEMSDLGIISRRKFFNNAFDGALTCAGIVSGNFIIFLSHAGQYLSSTIIVITGLSTALAIGISGLWGAFLSEDAERKKKISDLKKEMVIVEKNLEDQDKKKERREIQKAMITPIKVDSTDQYKKKFLISKKKNRKSEKKSLIEQSERFATIVASLVDGGAPVLGSVLPLLPFFFGTVLSVFHFIVSYAVLVGILVYLGIFLGNISEGGHLKYTLHLVTAGITTLLVSLLLELAISP
ncbi:MAG: VIT1/CCC1 transporter family protein [Candidatus Lokiarchaeota archaeon]|nr:VIT1/CCC1 transporter family protein [Candidatus Lokiarchaeota archaeon]